VLPSQKKDVFVPSSPGRGWEEANGTNLFTHGVYYSKILSVRWHLSLQAIKREGGNVCIQGEPKESTVNSCKNPRPGKNSFVESYGRNIGQNNSMGNAYNYLLI